jgi:hypothetical protein
MAVTMAPPDRGRTRDGPGEPLPEPSQSRHHRKTELPGPIGSSMPAGGDGGTVTRLPRARAAGGDGQGGA